MPRGFDSVVELVTPGQGPRRQPLHDNEVGVAIDGDARQAFALAAPDTHRLRLRPAIKEAAKLSRTREPGGDRPLTGRDIRRRVAGHDAHGNGVLAVDVATCHELSIARDQLNHGASRFCHLAYTQGVLEQPWMPRGNTRCDIGGDAILAYP